MQFPGKSRHRRPARTARIAALTGVAGVAIAVPMMTANGAQAASADSWDKVAQCESSGNWQADTGNGHYGGLQFSSSSWAAAGGTKYAPRADMASKGQQISVAERLLAQQGPGAWQCAGAGGLSPSGPPADTNPGGSGASQPGGQQTRQPQTPPSGEQNQNTSPAQPQGGGDYTVKPGDTLAEIASAHQVDLKKLYERNASAVGRNMNLILPGQKLQIG